MTTFEWHGQSIEYFDHPYNTTRLNERAVELAVAREWLHDAAVRDGRAIAGLEVGNVLGHYGVPWERRIVDLTEHHVDVENIDVLSIDGRYDWIVSVSTIEHVGQDDGTARPLAAVDAVHHLRSLLNPGGRMLITAPLGWNTRFDHALLHDDAEHEFGWSRSTTFVRDGDGWIGHAGVVWLPYGSVAPGWAAAVWIGEWA